MEKYIIFGIIGIVLIIIVWCLVYHRFKLKLISNEPYDEATNPDTYRYNPESMEQTKRLCGRNFCGDQNDCGSFELPYMADRLVKYPIRDGYIQSLEGSE